jgi:hypothetical protein
MQQYYSLLSVVFMIGFVFVFDNLHQERSDTRFCSFGLMGAQDMNRILQILAACQDN